MAGAAAVTGQGAFSSNLNTTGSRRGHDTRLISDRHTKQSKNKQKPKAKGNKRDARIQVPQVSTHGSSTDTSREGHRIQIPTAVMLDSVLITSCLKGVTRRLRLPLSPYGLIAGRLVGGSSLWVRADFLATALTPIPITFPPQDMHTWLLPSAVGLDIPPLRVRLRRISATTQQPLRSLREGLATRGSGAGDAKADV